MSPYSLLVALHVMGAVMSAGPVLAIAVAPPSVSMPVTQRLLRTSSLGLLVLLVTGASALAMTGGALAHSWWLRLSLLLFLLLGALTGALRRAARLEGSGARTRRLAWWITAITALVVYLMEAKPL